MSLLGFRYLNRRRILTLVFILTLTSMLFLITAFSFLGLYNGFTNYVGEEKDVVAIYGSAGSTPLTGLVPLYLADEIGSVDGVLATSPEVIVPVVINGESIFLRGVIPEELSQLNTLTATEGEMLNLTELNDAIIGKGLSEKLNLKVGDQLLVFSVLSEKYANLQVKGIFESGSPMDDEALVPIYVGQWLRGVGYNQVTVIRAKIDQTQIGTTQIYQAIANESSPTGASPSPTPKGETAQQLEGLISISKTKFDLQGIGVEDAQNFMKSYLNRYGVSKDTLIIISIVVLVFASGTAACALNLFINQHKHEIGVLRSVGASAKRIKADLIVKVVAWSLLASSLGTILSAVILMVFQNVGYLQVLSHSIVFSLDPLIIAANFILISAIVAIGITRSEMRQ